MRKFIFEILSEAGKAKKKADKIRILQENNSGALQDVLRGTYDDRIVWLLPQGAPPPFTPNRPETTPSNLLKECVMLKYLVRGAGYDNMLSVKREKIFIGLLESVHPKDADVLLDLINKRPIEGISKAIVKEAFPSLLP